MQQPVRSPDLATPFITARHLVITTTVSAVYLLLAALLIGFKTEQAVLVVLFNGLYYLSAATRKFILGFSIFIVYWIIFDSMKAFPNYRFNHVNIESLYDAEKYLFGIRTNGVILTPNEFWMLHSNSFLNVLTGFFYLCWVPVPLAFAAYLFYYNREQFLRFAFTFLVVNLIGFIIYYVYPAAPPWYVAQYGYTFHASTPGNTAGLHRFDAFFNVHIFQSLYAKSSNVFAAMPSLHSSYPVIVLYYGLRNKLGKINILFATIMGGIFFAAVYNDHHYILDVLAGILTAFAGIFIFNYLSEHNRTFRCFFNRMKAVTQ